MNTADWFALINKEFTGTSDRSCVIYAASIVDHMLTDILRCVLVPSPTKSDPLIDGPNAPMGSFSSRIDALFRLGLISAKAARDFHRIRRMRNDQAHTIESRTFDDPGLKSQVKELAKSLDINNRVPFLIKGPYDSVRGNFELVIVLIVDHLDEIQRKTISLNALAIDGLYTRRYIE